MKSLCFLFIALGLGLAHADPSAQPRSLNVETRTEPMPITEARNANKDNSQIHQEHAAKSNPPAATANDHKVRAPETAKGANGNSPVPRPAQSVNAARGGTVETKPNSFHPVSFPPRSFPLSGPSLSDTRRRNSNPPVIGGPASSRAGTTAAVNGTGMTRRR